MLFRQGEHNIEGEIDVQSKLHLIRKQSSEDLATALRLKRGIS